MEGLRGEIVVQNTHCYMSRGKLEDFGVLFQTMLTSNDVEHSGVEDGWTDQS